MLTVCEVGGWARWRRQPVREMVSSRGERAGNGRRAWLSPPAARVWCFDNQSAPMFAAHTRAWIQPAGSRGTVYGRWGLAGQEVVECVAQSAYLIEAAAHPQFLREGSARVPQRPKRAWRRWHACEAPDGRRPRGIRLDPGRPCARCADSQVTTLACACRLEIRNYSCNFHNGYWRTRT